MFNNYLLLYGLILIFIGSAENNFQHQPYFHCQLKLTTSMGKGWGTTHPRNNYRLNSVKSKHIGNQRFCTF